MPVKVAVAAFASPPARTAKEAIRISDAMAGRWKTVSAKNPESPKPMIESVKPNAT